VTSTLPAVHLVQSDTQNEAGTKIERLSLPADPLLGDPLAASYDDVDPDKGSAVTNAAPSAVSEGISGPTFHAWSASSAHAVFTDTWASSHAVNGTGAFEVTCPTVSAPPGGTPPTGGTLPTDGTSPTTGAPATNPPSRPGKHKKHKHHTNHAKIKAPRLSLALTADATRAHPSSVLGYRITVTNPGGTAARDVKVCDSPPAGQRVLRTFPSADGKDEPCWAIPALPAGARRVFQLTAMVEPLSASGVQRNGARATAANVKGVRRDQVAVQVGTLPETACGSRLARPLMWSPVRYRC
jgi:uncharacterized repeat protein (TIGR01451 family)